METAATEARNLRSFLLVTQLDPQAVGARIKQARLEAGLTQEALVELATFSVRALQTWESGNTIPYRHLREIGALLNRPTEWFLHGEREAAEGSQESFARHLDDIEGKLDRLVAIVERIAEDRAGARDGPDDHRSASNG